MQHIFKRFSPNRLPYIHILIDCILLASGLYFSLWLRLGDARLDDHLGVLHYFVLPFIFIRIVTFIAFGVYQSLWRYISTFDAWKLVSAVAFSTPLITAFTYMVTSFGVLPRSFFVIDAFVSSALLMAMRLLRRRIYEQNLKPQKSHVTLGKLVIYGAGQNGLLLAQRLLSDPVPEADLLGFIDDDKQKRDKHIHGLPILGDHSEMENILEKSGCTDLVVAITNPPADLMRELVLLGRKLGIRIQRIAHFTASQILSRHEALYRQIELKDLLNRPSAEIDVPSIKSILEGKVVLVTGAGGSIGSELSRKIARFSPGKLLLLDHSEFNLYEIDRELRPAAQNFENVIPLLTDIKDLKALESVFSKYKPQAVFHAAAYKHVHLVEANVHSAIVNNVQGTKNLLELSERFGVERFVMVSTDKAVNPVGAMGSTKRVCELLTTQAGQRTRKPYTSVRFGNVLGSSGSLIPLISKQIEEGGPVTLTHPDMTRYFMLIPEAVALILMSATLSQAGDINVLKMGDPIRILDLAQSLMAIMGKGKDEISIAFTGVRPGEKMYEELYLTGDELTTRHADILTVPRTDSVSAEFVRQADQLIHMAHQSDAGALALLLKLANEKVRESKPGETHESTGTHTSTS